MNVNIIDVGIPPRKIFERFGTTGQWIVNSLPDYIQSNIIKYFGQALSNDTKPDGWIISGSFLSVNDPSHLIEKLIWETKELINQNMPILGICFGHQLLAKSMGGIVSVNPNGIEIGYKAISLTDEGRSYSIFKDLQNTFSSCQCHYDVVMEPPKDSLILAKNEFGIQSINYGNNIFGVQFHPELNMQMMNIMSSYFAKTTNTADLERSKETSDFRTGKQVLLNFLNVIKKERNYANATL